MTVHNAVTAFNRYNIEYGSSRVDGKRYNPDTAKLIAETGTLEQYNPLYFNVKRVYRKKNTGSTLLSRTTALALNTALMTLTARPVLHSSTLQI